MRVLSETDVAAVLERIDLVAVMREALRALASGRAESPARAVVRPEGVWFAAMPASIAGQALGAKLVAAAPANASRGLPTHDALVVLFDPSTAQPHALVCAETLTRARTAAVSVVATQACALRPRGVHAILGGGAQGLAHVHAFARAGLVERFVLWSRSESGRVALAHAARAAEIPAHVVESADVAVYDADVVTTTTSSAEPLFAVGALRSGAHVNAVGACVPDRRELDGALVREAVVIADSLAAARVEAGDLVLAAAEGAFAFERVRELGAILAGAAVPRARFTVFESLGLGVEDVAAAAAVLAALTSP